MADTAKKVWHYLINTESNIILLKPILTAFVLVMFQITKNAVKRKVSDNRGFQNRGRIKIFVVQENTLPDLKVIAIYPMEKQYMEFIKVCVSA